MAKEVRPASKPQDEFDTFCGGIQPEPLLPPLKEGIPFSDPTLAGNERIEKVTQLFYEASNMDELTARDWNRIICAVNAKQTAEAAGLKTDEELRHYRNIWNEAEELFAKYGSWPVFDLAELE